MTALAGLRVLVVEDEAPIAMLIEDMVQDMGCVVAGFAATVSEALKLVKNGGFDFALLDMNLGGAKVDAVADALAAGGNSLALPAAAGAGIFRPSAEPAGGAKALSHCRPGKSDTPKPGLGADTRFTGSRLTFEPTAPRHAPGTALPRAFS